VNLTTIRTEVRERVGELTADFFTDAQVDRAINEAVRRFAQAERWPWLITETTTALAADEDELEMPDNVPPNRVFNMMVVADGDVTPRQVERVSPDEGFRLRLANWQRTNRPRYYYIVRAATDSSATTIYTMRFVPTADQDYDVTFQYYDVPDDLSSGSDVPDMPIEYHDAIPSWAAGKLFLTELDISQKASEQFEMYSAILNQARAEVFKGSLDQVEAWGREHPGETGWLTEYDYVMGRVGGPLG